jgi:hypothetical protein
VETEPARGSVDTGDHVVGNLLCTEDLQAAGGLVALSTFRAIRLGSCLG